MKKLFALLLSFLFFAHPPALAAETPPPAFRVDFLQIQLPGTPTSTCESTIFDFADTSVERTQYTLVTGDTSCVVTDYSVTESSLPREGFERTYREDGFLAGVYKAFTVKKTYPLDLDIPESDMTAYVEEGTAFGMPYFLCHCWHGNSLVLIAATGGEDGYAAFLNALKTITYLGSPVVTAQASEPTMSEAVGKVLEELAKLSESEHGGYYLSDSSKVIIVNQLDGKPIDVPGIGQDFVQIHPAKYSLKALRDLQEALTPSMLRLHIQALWVNFEENRLEVHLFNAPDGVESEISEIAPEDDMVIFTEDAEPIVWLGGAE